jgi:hypothetical protein
MGIFFLQPCPIIQLVGKVQERLGDMGDSGQAFFDFQEVFVGDGIVFRLFQEEVGVADYPIQGVVDFMDYPPS